MRDVYEKLFYDDMQSKGVQKDVSARWDDDGIKVTCMCAKKNAIQSTLLTKSRSWQQPSYAYVVLRTSDAKSEGVRFALR